jgi:DNA-binding NtrC family response regulator
MTPQILCLLDAEGRARGAAPLVGIELVLGREIIANLGGGADPSVSRRHGRVFAEDGAWWVEDLASKNGTFHNGRRVADATALAVGDVIEIGPHRFRVSAGEPELAAQLYESATLVARRDGAPERLRLVLELSQLTATPATPARIAEWLQEVLGRALDPAYLAVWGVELDRPLLGPAEGSPFDTERLARVLQRGEILRGAGLAVPLGHDPAGVLVLGPRAERPLSDDDVGFAVTTSTLAGDALRRAARSARLALHASDDELIGESPALARARQAVDVVARYADMPVLLVGETGTGKELLARRLHRASGRAGPFVAVNVAALPAELIESELFGHAKGAFTGAVATRIGYFEYAYGGTLFLDEIGEMPAPLQAKLLRVLQEGAITRLGEPRPVPIDVRVVSATNADLSPKTRAGQFRDDLYYRLAGREVRVPPLRERAGDVERLARAFLARSVGRTPVVVREISAEAMAVLVAYRWPGNVRQLELTLRLAIIHAAADDTDTVGVEHLDERVRGAGPREAAPTGFARELAEAERAIVVRALQATQGNKREAARQLGWSINTLRDRLQRYAIGEAELDG